MAETVIVLVFLVPLAAFLVTFPVAIVMGKASDKTHMARILGAFGLVMTVTPIVLMMGAAVDFATGGFAPGSLVPVIAKSALYAVLGVLLVVGRSKVWAMLSSLPGMTGSEFEQPNGRGFQYGMLFLGGWLVVLALVLALVRP